MAAPSGTVWGDIAGSYGRIGIYATKSSTNTQTTVTVQVWFWSKYSVSDNLGNDLCLDNLSASGSATTSKGGTNIQTTVATGSGWSTSNQVLLTGKSYTYTHTRGTSASTRYIYAKLTGVDRVGATMYASTTVSIPALASYTVSYNANGGSGAPSSQTKYYGKTLTLSSTKPTRSGYTFVGWGTSTTDTSADYSAGGSYTANAGDTLYAIWKKTIELSYNMNGGSGSISKQTATVYNATTSYKFTLSSTKPTRTGYSFLGWSTSSTATSASYSAGGTITLSASDTLYAVWKINTYKVLYNANGGTGAPSGQIKTYGTTLKLSTTIPTKANYNFLGWATSASATVATYTAGGSYTANAAVTLYAVWELAYVKPRITNLVIERGFVTTDDAGAITFTPSESMDTTNARVTFEYECDQMCINLYVEFENDSYYKKVYATDYPSDETLTRGSGEAYISDGTLSTEVTYTVKVTVIDGDGDNYQSIEIATLTGYAFTVDFLAGGKGGAFGKPAELEGVLDVAWQTRFFGGIMHPYLEPETDLDDVLTPNTYIGANVSTYNYVNCPLTSGTFSLEVTGMGEEGQIKQRLTYCHKTSSRAWERIYHSTDGVMSWGEWVCVSDFDGQYLADPKMYMTSGHTVTLAEPISKQRTGIVLVFCAYENGTVGNYHFECHFVPKYVINYHGGGGFNFHLSTSDFSYIGTKYLYIYDDKIIGHDNNGKTGASNGVTYANNHWVLRYVIGV